MRAASRAGTGVERAAQAYEQEMVVLAGERHAPSQRSSADLGQIVAGHDDRSVDPSSRARSWPTRAARPRSLRGGPETVFGREPVIRDHAGFRPEWGDVLRDLDRLQHATIESGGKTWTVRTQADGCAAALLQAAGIAPPPRIQATPPPQIDIEPALPKRRGRPRRSATPS